MTPKLKTENLLPPYLSYKTLTNYLDALRESGIPDRIDRSVMRNLSGTLQNQLLTTLSFLGLMDEFQFPTDSLKQLVLSDGSERQQILQGILKEAYPTLLGENTGGFRLSSASSQQFDEKFRELGVKGDTVRKCEYFFLAAAREANLQISSYIKPTTHQGPEGIRATGNGNGNGNGGKGRVATNPTRKAQQGTRVPTQQSFPISEEPDLTTPAKTSPAAPNKPRSLQEMLANSLNVLSVKYPEFDPAWDGATQIKWFESWEKVADRLLTMLDKIEKTQIEGVKEVE